MINNIAFLVTFCMGQFTDPYGYSMVSGSGPTIFIDYLYGTMQVKSKFEAEIKYNDGRLWKVPVINGYMPKISMTRLPTGSLHYVLDYRYQFSYKSISVSEPQIVPKQSMPDTPSIPESDHSIPLPELPSPVEMPAPLPAGMLRPSDVADPARVVLPKYEKSDK